MPTHTNKRQIKNMIICFSEIENETNLLYDIFEYLCDTVVMDKLM